LFYKFCLVSDIRIVTNSYSKAFTSGFYTLSSRGVESRLSSSLGGFGGRTYYTLEKA